MELHKEIYLGVDVNINDFVTKHPKSILILGIEFERDT